MIQKELFYTKKDIIENNLFGVDINPNSCEITKLRLWIELLKHSFYQSFEDEAYHDLKTLPNIDINIKCGNSLISRFKPNDKFSNNNIKSQVEKYKNFVKDYKNPNQTAYRRNKEELRVKIKDIKAVFALELKNPSETKELQKNIDEHMNKFGDFMLDNETLFEGLKGLSKEGILFKKELSLDEQKKAIESFYKIKAQRAKIDYEMSGEEFENSFEWRFEFPEILDDDGNFQGFDLIIGNPPYIRQEELKELKPHLAKNYKVYKGTSDIYTYFYELGFNVLKDRGGVLSYITSNKYTRAGYGEALREFLLKNVKFLEYTDLNGIKVFDSATVDTSILCFEKSKSKDNKFKYLALSNEILKTCAYDIGLYKDFAEFSQNSLSKESFTFSDENTSALKAKIERIGTPLKEWYGLNINYGIKTGLNEAFIITTEKRNEILANCKDEAEKERTAKLIRKMLRGRDIKRYSYEWAGLWVIGTFPSLKIDIEQYPALKQYLSQFLPRIEQSGEKGCRKKTSNKWFETQDNIAYYEEFEKEKIVYPETTQGAYFVYDNKGIFLEKTAFFIVCENLKYLLGLLSSNLITYYYKNFSQGCKLGTKGYQYNKHALENLPIPKINSKNQNIVDELINLVDEILKAKEQDKNANTQELENKINSLVYKLYNLTEEEIKIIEGK